MPIRRRIATVALLLVVLGVAACGAASPAQHPPSPHLPPPAAVPPSRASHVVTIVMENKTADAVLGPHGMPFVKRLARRYGLATSSYAVAHPSLPNYLALVGGSTFGIASDCTSCRVHATSIVDELAGRGIGWRAYMEGAPRACFRGALSRSGYAKKHDPFMYFDGIAGNRARCNDVVPLTRLARDLRQGRLPPYAWISPGLCNDTHDCPLAVGNRFLAGLVPGVLRALGPRGFLVLTWDEGVGGAGCCGGARGGHIATVVAGPGVRRGARLARPVDDYGVLRTVESALGVPPLAAAADPRHGSLDGLFARSPRVA